MSSKNTDKYLLSYLLSFSLSLIYLKFIYSKEATKFYKIFTLLLSCVVPVKNKVKISQNFVAFSDYINFTNVGYGVSKSSVEKLLILSSKWTNQENIFTLKIWFELSLKMIFIFEHYIGYMKGNRILRYGCIHIWKSCYPLFK